MVVVDELAASGDAGSVPKLVHARERKAGAFSPKLPTFPYGSLAVSTEQCTG
jgi:hypothetical protein